MSTCPLVVADSQSERASLPATRDQRACVPTSLRRIAGDTPLSLHSTSPIAKGAALPKRSKRYRTACPATGGASGACPQPIQGRQHRPAGTQAAAGRWWCWGHIPASAELPSVQRRAPVANGVMRCRTGPDHYLHKFHRAWLSLWCGRGAPCGGGSERRRRALSLVASHPRIMRGFALLARGQTAPP